MPPKTEAAAREIIEIIPLDMLTPLSSEELDQLLSGLAVLRWAFSNP